MLLESANFSSTMLSRITLVSSDDYARPYAWYQLSRLNGMRYLCACRIAQWSCLRACSCTQTLFIQLQLFSADAAAAAAAAAAADSRFACNKETFGMMPDHADTTRTVVHCTAVRNLKTSLPADSITYCGTQHVPHFSFVAGEQSPVL